jgi:hypothetical protein
MGQKEIDILGAWACPSCHNIVDGRGLQPEGYSRQDILFAFYEGIFRTQKILVQDKIVKW